jgi:hypothetical protein
MLVLGAADGGCNEDVFYSTMPNVQHDELAGVQRESDA